MDIKIWLMLLLVAFLSALFHAGKAQDSCEQSPSTLHPQG
jgi:hypothetical protein